MPPSIGTIISRFPSYTQSHDGRRRHAAPRAFRYFISANTMTPTMAAYAVKMALISIYQIGYHCFATPQRDIISRHSYVMPA